MTSRVVIILDQVNFVTETKLKTRFPKQQNKTEKTNNNNKKARFPRVVLLCISFYITLQKTFLTLGAFTF